MVHENQYHPLPEQGRSLQIEARPLSTGQLFPRLLRRQRRQPSSKIPIMAIQSSQSRTPQSIPPVSPPKIPIHAAFLYLLMLSQASHKLLTHRISGSSLPQSRTQSFTTRWQIRASYESEATRMSYQLVPGQFSSTPQGTSGSGSRKQCTYPPLTPPTTLNLGQERAMYTLYMPPFPSWINQTNCHFFSCFWHRTAFRAFSDWILG